MNQTYAVIDSSGKVFNSILWDGYSVFDKPEGSTLIPIGDTGAGIGWSYIDGKFVKPKDETLTKDQYILKAEAKKSDLINLATQKIGPLQDAVDLDIATDEEKTQLTAWKKYRVLVNRVDTSTAPNITWPTSPDDESTSTSSTATTTGDATTS